MEEGNFLRALTIGVSIFVTLATVTTVILFYNSSRQIAVTAVKGSTDISSKYRSDIEESLTSSTSVDAIQVINILNYFYNDSTVKINVKSVHDNTSGSPSIDNTVYEDINNNNESLYNKVAKKISSFPNARYETEYNTTDDILEINISATSQKILNIPVEEEEPEPEVEEWTQIDQGINYTMNNMISKINEYSPYIELYYDGVTRSSKEILKTDVENKGSAYYYSYKIYKKSNGYKIDIYNITSLPYETNNGTATTQTNKTSDEVRKAINTTSLSIIEINGQLFNNKTSALGYLTYLTHSNSTIRFDYILYIQSTTSFPALVVKIRN